tara:strand:+ start:1847 stop:2032 length:186 start_codon:yes stop_codon:yes gene_type:complete
MTDKDNQTLLLCERCKTALVGKWHMDSHGRLFEFVCIMCNVSIGEELYGKDSQQSSDDKHS